MTQYYYLQWVYSVKKVHLLLHSANKYQYSQHSKVEMRRRVSAQKRARSEIYKKERLEMQN